MNSKAKRNNQSSKNLGGEDFISGLPDDILSCILNFLPTKDAVCTSILARSWKNKWKLITSIDLHDFLTDLDREEIEIERAHSFIASVNKVLKLISNSSICKFGLHLEERTYDPQDLVGLFSEVLKREVKELDIYYEDHDIPAFPTCVFSSKYLKKLVLSMDNCTIRVQSSICLPKLQSLLLSGIQLLVTDDLFPHSKELVLSFPVLISFEAYRCCWSKVKDMSINAPMLETFTMEDSLFKFEHFDELRSSAIKIHAPHLREFSYQFISIEDIIFSNGSSIQDACIGLSELTEFDQEFHEISVKTGNLLKSINRVEFLEFVFEQFQFMRNPDLLNHVNDYLTTLPAFEKLLQLELFLPHCLASQKLLLNLIQKSPILQTLVLHYIKTEFHRNLLLVEEVPHCFLQTLEEVIFIVPEVDAIIIYLIKYVLQHSRVLKLMTINSSLKEPGVIWNIKQLLLSFPRASSNVIITVM